MAISIITNLQNWLPVYNRLELAVDSTNVGQDNFLYVFRVFIDGVPGYKQYEAQPENTNQYGILDFHNYAQTFLAPYLPDNTETVAFNQAIPAIKELSIECYEKWDVDGVPTFNPTGAQPLTFSPIYVFQGSYDNSFWLDWDANDYFVSQANGTNGRFLTDNLLNKVSINDLGWSYYLTNIPEEADKIQIVTYDSAGAVIDTFEVENLTSNLEYESFYGCVATSPQSLNNIGGGFLLGAQPIITSSVANYTVQLCDPFGNPSSELMYFEIKEPCRYTEYRFHFENKYGAFDSFTFEGRNQKTTSIKRSSYKTSKYPVTASGIVREHREKSNITNWTKRTEKIKLISDYLTTEENTWLEQMLYSNEIYLEFVDGSGVRNFKSVHKVTGTSWVEKETIHDKLFRLEIEVELGQEAYSQRK